MWCFSKFGGYSIVRCHGKTNQWQVRSRSSQDLINLIQRADLRHQKVIETLGRDYRWRLIVGADELSQIFSALESSVDYENYKSCLGRERGMGKLCSAAHRIWSVWASEFGGAYQSGGHERRADMDGDWQRKTFGHDAKPAERESLDLGEKWGGDHSALHDVEPPPPPMPKKRGTGRKPRRGDQQTLDV